MIIQTSSLRLLAAAMLVLSGCAHAPAVPDVDLEATALPPVAAQYLTTQRLDRSHAHGTVHDQNHENDVKWRLWRESDRITTQNLAAQTGELWQRDGATVFHQKLFHADRRSVEFQMDDLRMAHGPLSWSRQSLLLDPQLLARLTLRRSGWRNGYPYRRYEGESDGSRWDITIRTDLMLPVSIVRKRSRIGAGIGAELEERTQLQEAHALHAAPWLPTPRDDYEVIDFADLGDRQSDPFVVRVQDQLGRPHVH